MFYAPYVDAKDDRLAQICQVQPDRTPMNTPLTRAPRHVQSIGPPPFLMWQVQLFFALLSSVALNFDSIYTAKDTVVNKGSNFDALLVIVTVLPAAMLVFKDKVMPWLNRKKREELRGQISDAVHTAKEVTGRVKEISGKAKAAALLRRSAASSESETHKDAAPMKEYGLPSRASRVSRATVLAEEAKAPRQQTAETEHV